jgi:hypothetical protein
VLYSATTKVLAPDRNERMSLHEETLQDATSLLHFVDSISLVCDDGELTAAYPQSTTKFFQYIRQLATATRTHLDKFASRIPQDLSQFPDFRRELFSIRSGWMALHSFVQATVDADTLRLPTPMVDGLLSRFRQITGFADTQFAVFHVDDLNYLQVKSSHLRTIGDDLSAIVGASEFPKDLGLIGIPYSQSRSVFLNCLIPHEMGHFVYQTKGFRSALLPEIVQKLADVAGTEFTAASAELQSWHRDRLASWAEEIFCDSFACWLIGPCYSLAYIELFDLCRALLPTSTLDSTEVDSSGQFNESHPADLFRLKHHVNVLEIVGWWQEWKTYKIRHMNLLSEIRQLPSSTFFCEFGMGMDPFLIPAFEAVLPSVIMKLKDVMNNIEVGVGEFASLSDDIERYLANGVVPSTRNRKQKGPRLWGRKRSSTHYPSTVTLLNAGYKFYLQGLDELILGIHNEKLPVIDTRLKWMHKLEAWLLKAIEDHLLLNAESK